MILVTGGAGYIGSHCVLNLLERNQDVIIFDNLSTGHIETIKTLEKYGNLKFIEGDLKNIDNIQNVFKNNKIDTVFHFAGLSQVGESVKEPVKYYNNNVIGTKNLLNIMAAYNCHKIIFSSTAAIYGEPEYTPIDEKHPKKPINPYGETKLKIENLLDEYDNLHNIKSVRLRYFNVAGADEQSRIGEWHTPETHLIPSILKSALKTNQTFKLFGTDYHTPDGTCVRDYININDLINAHILAYKYLHNGGETNVFNLGSNNGNSVKEVFDTCEKITQKEIQQEIHPRREGDPAILIADNKKAFSILNWSPQKTLTDSIQSAWDWEIKFNKC